MEVANFHSGQILRKLREQSGLKENELAVALDCSIDDILDWEGQGVPEQHLPLLQQYFSVGEALFNHRIISEQMLEKAVLVATKSEALTSELRTRIQAFKSQSAVVLDLSSLGLFDLPPELDGLLTLEKLDLSDNLFIELPKALEIHWKSGCEIDLRRNFLPPDRPQQYNVDAPKRTTPLSSDYGINFDSLTLVSLHLVNIGIYPDIKIDFDKDLTVLIGINGAGKTTILKAISFAILGDRPSTKKYAAELRSLDLASHQQSYINLVTRVKKSGSGRAAKSAICVTNKIRLCEDPDTREIIIDAEQNLLFYHASNTFECLILGLGERRYDYSPSSGQAVKISEQKAPNLTDLLPLLTAQPSSCVKNFQDWWANMEAVKDNNPDAQLVIELCFEIFSEFMGESIRSAGLKKVKPVECWVQYANGKQVPFKLASQGYQTAMGWVGWIIQRMVEANSNRPNPLLQPAIILIDEIDQFLSIQWQSKILSILRKHLPNVQWIISTHSPVVLHKLDQNQIVQLHERAGRIIAEPNPVSLKMWQYGDIVRRFFDISAPEPMLQEQDIKREIEQLQAIPEPKRSQAQVAELEQKRQLLNDIQTSRANIDPLYEQQLSLHKKEQELHVLIVSLRDDK